MGFVLRRLRGRWPLAAAASLTVLLTAAVLCALSAFNSGLGDAGVRRALSVQDHSSTTLRITAASTDVSGRAAAEQQVQGLAARIFGPRLPSTVHELATSHAYALPASASATPAAPSTTPANTTSASTTPANTGSKPADPDLTLLAALDPAQVTVTAGRLPQPAAAAGEPLQVAVPDIALSRLGLRTAALPATLHLVDRYDGSALDVQVTGSYRATDPTAPYWQIDPVGGRGLQVSGFTTYGPLLAPDSVFTGGRIAQQGLSWVVTTDFTRARADDLDALRDRTSGQLTDFQQQTGFTATSLLPDVLDELHNDLLVATSTLVIGSLQLAVLAIAALILVTRLLTERQVAEDALLTARGAAWYRIAGLTALEAGLLVLPAAGLAPLLTAPLLRLLDHFGPLAHSGARLDDGLSPGSWLVALVIAACAGLMMLVPSALRAGGSALRRRPGRRQALRSGLVRSGADLALLALAVLAYLQLAHYSSASGAGTTATAAGPAATGGGALSADATGRLGLDPVLVTAPTLALCAGTLLALRLLPLAAKLGERWAGRRTGLPAALAGWQFARRPRRNAGPVLLLVLAVSMGLLALGQGASLTASQRDQADFATVGGLRVSALGVPAVGQGGVLAALPGGSRFLPVSRQPLPLHGGVIGQLLAVDSKDAATSVRLRPDLTGGRGAAQVFAPLTAGAGPADGLALPGEPTALDLDISVRTAESPPPTDLPPDVVLPPASLNAPELSLELRDRFGVTFEGITDALPDNGDRTVRIDLGHLFADPVGRPAYPLTLTGFQLSNSGGFGSSENEKQQVVVHQIRTVGTGDGAGTAVATAAGLNWQARTADSTPGAPSRAPQLSPGQDLLDVSYLTDSRATQEVSAAGPGGAAPDTVDAVATEDFLAATGASVGRHIPLQLGTANLDITIVEALPALPTAGSDSGGPTAALMVDLATLDRALTDGGGAPLGPTEWWLPSTGPADQVPARAATALRAGTVPARVDLAGEQLAGMRDDPLGAGPQSALLALTVAAAVLAAIGFAAAAVGAAGERAAEFAVLRALGAPHRQLARTAAAEQGILIALGLGVGTLLGTVLVHLVVPHTVLTPAAHRPMPPVLVVLPPWQVLVLLGAVAAPPVLLTLRRVLRRPRAAETVARLRHSEEM
ncbi:ABC transporter permease [Kitasatospora sp. NBC_01287]|uniref:FtsX-like permease family protein n=1 Tax=Kitasatospora sp. NBC_01287 TaxID=2903573 RepID=UPI00225B7961|nr:FtsX-like permease family protein [Kitasatospora sp. NBC_01287]MCX4746349.1 ABC transporter permease [Kitasatospora sp. NBC_01287]